MSKMITIQFYYYRAIVFQDDYGQTSYSTNTLKYFSSSDNIKLGIINQRLLTALKSGLSERTASRSGRADFDFPIAR